MLSKRKLAIAASAALLSPLAVAAGTSSASAAGFCDGYANPTTRTAYEGRTDVPWSYLWNPRPGTYTVCLDGPAGTNFDLSFDKYDPAVGDWVPVKFSRSRGSDEKITYVDTEGSTALYGVTITAVRGSGDYTVAFNHTPSS